jgi:hypothetical protein
MTQAAPKVFTLLSPRDVFDRDGEIVNRVVTRGVFGGEGGAIIWEVGAVHPLVPQTNIVRLFIVPGECVEVYAVKDDMKVGIRNLLPWHTVLLTEDTLNPEAFTEALTEADSAQPEPAPEPALKPNGGAAVPTA